MDTDDGPQTTDHGPRTTDDGRRTWANSIGLARPAGRAQSPIMRSDEQASPDQIKVLRRMTPEQRWRAAHRLYWTVRRHKAAFLHTQHPEWSDQRIQEEVRRIFLHART